MRRIILAAALASSLGGCSWLANTLGGTPDASTQTAIVNSFLSACQAYGVVLQGATVAAKGNALTAAQIAIVDKANAAAGDVCLGPMPTNVAGSAVIVVTATADIIAALHKGI